LIIIPILITVGLYLLNGYGFRKSGKIGPTPMSEFSSDVVRNTSDFAAKYLNNVFGAADTLELTTKIKDLLYGS